MPIAVAKHGFWWVFEPTPIIVSPSTVPNAIPDEPYTVTFTATGGSAPTSPFTFSFTGNIPTGTSLDPATGILSGTPTTDGTYNFTIIATDPNGYSGNRAYTIVVAADRSLLKSNNVLIVYDPNSVRPGMYVSDPDPATIASIIAARETSLGFVPTIITSYADLASANITNYAHLWDVGYDTLMTSTVADKYKAYLQTGGAAFLLGENGIFVQRNDTIDNFISSYMGGGSVDAGTYDPNSSITATVASEFLLANSNNSVTFNRPGRFESIGTGTAMATSGDGTHAAVWKTGSLSEAPTAAIASVLDINFVVGSGDSNFIDNLSLVLNKK
jgi:hypothetical protein